MIQLVGKSIGLLCPAVCDPIVDKGNLSPQPPVPLKSKNPDLIAVGAHVDDSGIQHAKVIPGNVSLFHFLK